MRGLILYTFLTVFFINNIFASPPSDQDIQIKAVRLKEPIQVDGRLNEAVWHNDSGVTEFFQRNPIEGAKPTEETIVRVAYDDEAIYIGARMYDSHPDSIEARLGRRDASLNTDAFGFFIDPYYDRRSGYFFGISAGGTLFDGVLLNDDWDNDSWDGVWEGKALIDEKGWTVEIRVPFSQLRFHKKDKYVWGINFRRDIARKNEEIFLVYTPKSGSGFVSRFKDLVGIENIKPSRNIELLPYLRTKAEFTNPEPGDPFNDGSRFLPGLGADLKIGLSSNLTLNTTINPDFGQVEVDPAVVNLSDVETFYSEKRPFFIEGSSIFNFGYGGSNSNWGFNWGDPDFFYSRRIGRAPQGSLPDNDFKDVPDGASILGAAKLSGKIGNNWNIGVIHAVTAREFADYEYNQKKSEIEVEPLSNYSILRVQKEIDEGFRGIGFLSTSAIRNFDDKRLKDELNAKAFSFGMDGWTFLDKDKTWVLNGWAGITNVQGNKNRMTDLQRNSSHYFQRPDASHLSVDSNLTSMTGFAGRVALNKQKGNFYLNTAIGFINPEFDVNDLGYMRRTDVINSHIVAGYKWTKPGKFTRNARIYFSVFNDINFNKTSTWKGVWNSVSLQFLNYYELSLSASYSPETYNTFRTRGGPLTINKPSFDIDIFAETDDRKDWVFGIGACVYSRNDGYRMHGFEAELEWKPKDNISFSLNPGIKWRDDKSRWIGAFDDSLAERTYGVRYVYSDMKQIELSSSIRLNWTFTPKLSLQLYIQPLISSGDHSNFKELDRPKSIDFNIYGEGNSTIDFIDGEYVADPDGSGPADPISLGNLDFNYKSLRGNAVLRWEYLPGSILYFVWTQSRSEDENIGEFQFNRSLRRLVSSEADNIFMIKLTYWWNL